MIYAYSTLLNEKAEVKARLKEMKEVLGETGNDEVYEMCEELDSYIKGIDEACKILEKYVFVD